MLMGHLLPISATCKFSAWRKILTSILSSILTSICTFSEVNLEEYQRNLASANEHIHFFPLAASKEMPGHALQECARKAHKVSIMGQFTVLQQWLLMTDFSTTLYKENSSWSLDSLSIGRAWPLEFPIIKSLVNGENVLEKFSVKTQFLVENDS